MAGRRGLSGRGTAWHGEARQGRRGKINQMDCTCGSDYKHVYTEILPVKMTNSNDGQGRGWYSSSNERKRIRDRLIEFRKKTPYGRCDVVLTRILGKKERLWDSGNILRGNAKQLIDTLVELGWWEDDGPRYIRHLDGRQDPNRRSEGSCVEIKVCVLRRLSDG